MIDAVVVLEEIENTEEPKPVLLKVIYEDAKITVGEIIRLQDEPKPKYDYFLYKGVRIYKGILA